MMWGKLLIFSTPKHGSLKIPSRVSEKFDTSTELLSTNKKFHLNTKEDKINTNVQK